MAKVTSKLQVTVPKAIADRLGISPGDEIEWRIEGNTAHVRKHASSRQALSQHLKAFDEATERQDERNRIWARAHRGKAQTGRGWSREDLYTRGRAR